MVTERYWKNILTVQALENLTYEVKQNFIHGTKPVTVQKNNSSSEKHCL